MAAREGDDDVRAPLLPGADKVAALAGRRPLAREETTLLLRRVAVEDPEHSTLAWWIFVVLGVGVLLPWNCFLTAYDYYTFLYPDFPYEFVMSLAYNIPAVITLIVSVKLAPKISFTTRIVTGLIVNMIVVALSPVIPFMGLSVTTARNLSLFLVMITGVASSNLFGSVVGYSSVFPARYTGAVMSGIGVAGLTAFALRVFTKVVLPSQTNGVDDADSIHASAGLYFGAAALVNFLCIGCYYWLKKMAFAMHYKEKYYTARRESSRVNLADDLNDGTYGATVAAKAAAAAKLNSVAVASGRVDHDDVGAAVHPTPAAARVEPAADRGIAGVISDMRAPLTGIFLIFFVTLLLFPGMLTEMQTSTSLGDWFQIFILGAFMVGDYIGRTLASFVKLMPKRYMVVFAAARVVFVPLIIFSVKPQEIDPDYFGYGIVFVMALTNGYVGTLTLMYAPTYVDDHHKEIAGLLMSLALNIGIVAGAAGAIALLWGIEGESPF